jgi:hypothetical protein
VKIVGYGGITGELDGLLPTGADVGHSLVAGRPARKEARQLQPLIEAMQATEHRTALVIAG